MHIFSYKRIRLSIWFLPKLFSISSFFYISHFEIDKTIIAIPAKIGIFL